MRQFYQDIRGDLIKIISGIIQFPTSESTSENMLSKYVADESDLEIRNILP